LDGAGGSLVADQQSPNPNWPQNVNRVDLSRRAAGSLRASSSFPHSQIHYRECGFFSQPSQLRPQTFGTAPRSLCAGSLEPGSQFRHRLRPCATNTTVSLSRSRMQSIAGPRIGIEWDPAPLAGSPQRLDIFYDRFRSPRSIGFCSKMGSRLYPRS